MARPEFIAGPMPSKIASSTISPSSFCASISRGDAHAAHALGAHRRDPVAIWHRRRAVVAIQLEDRLERLLRERGQRIDHVRGAEALAAAVDIDGLVAAQLVEGRLEQLVRQAQVPREVDAAQLGGEEERLQDCRLELRRGEPRLLERARVGGEEAGLRLGPGARGLVRARGGRLFFARGGRRGRIERGQLVVRIGLLVARRGHVWTYATK